MRIKSVVKVMNFHSLLRVDSSRRRAEMLFEYEQMAMDLIDTIMNNKNLILDKKMYQLNEKGIDLNIYIANDLRFCGNLNSNILESVKKDTINDKVIIGKKVSKIIKDIPNTLFLVDKKDYYNINENLYATIVENLKNQRYKSINLIYNHYYNISSIGKIKQQIIPMKKTDIESNDKYSDDFIIEGNINKIFINIMAMYVIYQIRIAVENSFASENITRQMVTKQSLKKIDELEQEKKIKQRKELSIKNLKKQLDSINSKSCTEDEND